MPDFSWSFGEDVPPFQEAVDVFLAKNIVSRAEFEAMSAELRRQSFAVAYVHQADQVQAVYDALLASVRKGLTFQDFSRSVEHILANPAHRRTVFNTNVLSAYGEGHWQQAQAVKHLREFVRFSAVIDGRTTWQCRALHGTVLPVDHPYVRANWTPRHYNCRSIWLTLSRREVEEQGLKITTDESGLPPANPKFSSPALGGRWEPDYNKYAPEIGAQLRDAVKAIYD